MIRINEMRKAGQINVFGIFVTLIIFIITMSPWGEFLTNVYSAI